jgi:general secretion pathway protein G
MTDVKTIALAAPHTRRRGAACVHSGFTLVELMIALTVLGIVAALAVPSYQSYVERAGITRMCADFSSINLKVAQFADDHKRYPDSLADIGQDQLRDQWGRPYEYLNLTVAANLNQARKNKNLHPISTDFDLYSKGADGNSVKPLTAQPSRDDIIRAGNGAFCGLVRDYD